MQASNLIYSFFSEMLSYNTSKILSKRELGVNLFLK